MFYIYYSFLYKKEEGEVGDKYVYTFYQSVIGRVEELDDCFLAD